MFPPQAKDPVLHRLENFSIDELLAPYISNLVTPVTHIGFSRAHSDHGMTFDLYFCSKAGLVSTMGGRAFLECSSVLG